MKVINYLALVILGIAVILFAFKECEHNPSKLEVKSNASLKADSIKRIQTEIYDRKLDSIIKIQYKKDSVYNLKSKSLTNKRNRLLSIVRGFSGVKVDTLTQTVYNIPIAVYEAEMNSNLICDTLLQFKDVQISIRDSIVSITKKQLYAQKELNVGTQKALQDLIALNEQNEKKLKRAKSLNKKIPLIMAIEAGVILLLIAL